MTLEFRRKLIGGYEIASGAILVSLGTALTLLSGSRLTGIIASLVNEERLEDPNDSILYLVQHHIPDFLHGKVGVAAVFLAYGILKMTGGIGLLRRKPWGFYLLLGLMVVLLPPDLYRFAIKPALGYGVLNLIHVSILYALVRYRRSFLDL